MKTKQIIAAIKKCSTTKSALPSTSCAFFTGETIEVTNLDVFLSIPFQSNHKASVDVSKLCTIWDTIGNHVQPSDATDKQAFFKSGSKLFKVANEYSDDDRAKYSGFDKDKSKLVGNIGCDDIEEIKIAVKYIGNDSLRMVLSNVCLRDNRIAATDSHRLYFSKEKSNLPKEDQILLSATTVALLTAFEPNHWDLYLNEDGNATLISKDGITIHDRAYSKDSRQFPNYLAVIPSDKEMKVSISAKTKDFKDVIKIGSKFASQNTRKMTLSCSQGLVTAKFEDQDYDTEYTDTVSSASFKSENNEDFEIGFNYNFFSEILADCGDHFTIKCSTPTKATVINDSFLLMPIMLTN